MSVASSTDEEDSRACSCRGYDAYAPSSGDIEGRGWPGPSRYARKRMLLRRQDENIQPNGHDAPDPASICCDVYVNSIAKVVRYHLPIVRCALSGEELYIAPSCAIALATRVCLDYHYFASAYKTPYEIITKKWSGGYNFVVNGREQSQLTCFAISSDAFLRAKLRFSSDDDLRNMSCLRSSFISDTRLSDFTNLSLPFI